MSMSAAVAGPRPVVRTHLLPRISVVIPAYNEEAMIRQSVEALLDQTLRPWEIIVVDNRSTDMTPHLVRQLARRHPEAGIRLLQQDEEQGITPTRNMGFDAVTGDVIARIDADTRVRPDWVHRLAMTFMVQGTDAVTGPVSFYDLPAPRFTGAADRAVRRLTLLLSDGHTFLFGSNMAMRRDAWLATRAHTCSDKTDEMHEDLDLAIHLEEAGFTVAYDGRLRADISGRRGATSKSDFAHYLGRLDRTYAEHLMFHPGLRTPARVMSWTYPLLNLYSRRLSQEFVRPSLRVV